MFVMIRDHTRNQVHQIAVVEPTLTKMLVIFDLRKLVKLNALLSFFQLEVCRDQSVSSEAPSSAVLTAALGRGPLAAVIRRLASLTSTSTVFKTAFCSSMNSPTCTGSISDAGVFISSVTFWNTSSSVGMWAFRQTTLSQKAPYVLLRWDFKMFA